MTTRPMDFAGSWYPRDAAACEAEIRAFWRNPLPVGLPTARLGVAPHAGWVFSGALAGRVYQALRGGPGVPLVVVLGGHLGRRDPVVAMCEGKWGTPFGDFAIHGGFRERLQRLPQVRWETPSAYRPDNSTELQLPFARFVFPQAELLPLRLPPGAPALQVARELGAYLREKVPGAAVVASTDLTHYGPNYGFEPQGRGQAAVEWVRGVNDAAFIAAVERVDGQGILDTCREHRNACAAGAVAAVSELAAADGLRFHQLGYANSAEVMGRDTTNFVGYLGGVFA